MDAPLVAERVAHAFGETAALDDVSLSVETGETFALIGPNGAGKTTLVRSITGTLRPDRGDVRLFGAPPSKVDPERIGLLPQSFSPPGRLTAEELVEYYGGLYDDALDPGEALSAVGVETGSTWYEDLSGGEKRRACVGCTLVNDPDLLVLDEPTAGVDPAGRRRLQRLLSDLADRGTTIFLTTHDMAEAERLADRVGLLANGRLVAVGSPADLVAERGGENRLVIRTDDAIDVSTDRIDNVGALANDGVETSADADFRIERTRDRIVLHGIEPTDIEDAVRWLDRHGVDYESLRWTQPTLEDVYLALVEERFDAGEVAGEYGREADGIRRESDRPVAGGER